MGLEGAVHLGFKKELDAAATEAEREALFAKLIGALYDRGKATEAATHLEIDAVIEQHGGWPGAFQPIAPT